MKPILTEQLFPLLEGEEGRLFEFNELLSRSELNTRITNEDPVRPWVHATSDDLMEFARKQSRQFRELGLKCKQGIGDEDFEDVVVAMGSTGQNGPACHNMCRGGWNMAFTNTGRWGGEGMFFLVKRSIRT